TTPLAPYGQYHNCPPSRRRNTKNVRGATVAEIHHCACMCLVNLAGGRRSSSETIAISHGGKFWCDYWRHERHLSRLQELEPQSQKCRPTLNSSSHSGQ